MLGVPGLVLITWLVANQFVKLPNHIPESLLHLTLLPFAELLFLLVLLQIACRVKENGKFPYIWVLTFIFTLANLLMVILFRQYYNNPARANYASVQLVLKISIVAIVLLSFAALLSFLKAFSNQLKRLSNQISFEEKPVSRRFTLIFLVISFIFGLTLRLINIDQLPPYVDEYLHTDAAYTLLHGGQIGYFRALIPVTFPVLLSYKIFGPSIWASRLPMVLLSMTAIFPLYFFAKKMNQIVGYISVVLFVTSPWIIGLSKTIREYSIAPLFFYLIALLLINLLNWEETNLKQYLKSNAIRMLILLILLGHIFYDKHSILRIIIGIYGVVGLIAVVKLLKQKTSKVVKYLVVGIGMLLLLVLVERSRIINLIKDPADVLRWNPLYIDILFKGTNQQWHYLGFLGYLVVLVGAFIAARIFYENNKKSDCVVLFIFLIFSIFILGLTISIPNGEYRYGSLVEYWYLLLVAIFLYQIVRISRRLFKHRLAQVALPIVIFLGLFTNYGAIYRAISYTGGEVSPVTHETHSRVAPAVDFLLENISEADILLTDSADKYGKIVGKPITGVEIFNVYKIRSGDYPPASEFIKSNPSGWIAVSPHARRSLSDIPDSGFKINGISVEYLGLKGDISMWRWPK